MPIRKLPALLVNQIAAGEVIERPASVVKELVENSIDAGATRISIAIEDGGRQLIRISDDGCGIPADELELAIAPHATSKLTSSEQLAAIATLGFRGEALASIASVSRLRITSRPRVKEQDSEESQAVGTTHGEKTSVGDESAPTWASGKESACPCHPEDDGATLEVAGADVQPVQPAACPPGTTIEVRDLFFNTPARRKFLRAASTEIGQISDTITRLAMVHHRVGFTLSHNDRTSLDVAATTSRRQRCVDLLGKELDEALLEFEEVSDFGLGIADEAIAAHASADQKSKIKNQKSAIWGLAGLPAIARATAKFQYICLNGRFIRDRTIAHAIKEAYRGLTPPDRQPVAVVFLDMPPALVDVNVHPTKAEVRFREPSRVHGLVLGALRGRLLGADLTPSVNLPRDKPMFSFDAAGNDSERNGDASSASSPFANGPFAGAGGATDQSDPFAAPASPFRTNGGAHGESNDADAAHNRGASSNDDHTRAFVDYFRRMAPTQKGFVYEQVRQAMSETDPGFVAQSDAQPSSPGTDNDTGKTSPSDAALGFADPSVPPVLRSFGVLQVHKSYLVTEDEHGILIIDQHALHERVMFEQLRQRIAGGNLESQRLLMPVTLTANAQRQAVLEALEPLLTKIGIEAAPMGPETIAIHAFPTFLFDRKVDPAEFVDDLLDQADDGRLDVSSDTAMEAALHETLDMMSCKAAVKAGDKLSAEELADLLRRRGDIDRASNCPHGRPTTIRLTLRDLEKQFKRT